MLKIQLKDSTFQRTMQHLIYIPAVTVNPSLKL